MNSLADEAHILHGKISEVTSDNERRYSTRNQLLEEGDISGGVGWDSRVNQPTMISNLKRKPQHSNFEIMNIKKEKQFKRSTQTKKLSGSQKITFQQYFHNSTQSRMNFWILKDVNTVPEMIEMNASKQLDFSVGTKNINTNQTLLSPKISALHRFKPRYDELIEQGFQIESQITQQMPAIHLGMSENSTDLSSNSSLNKYSVDHLQPNISNFEVIMEESIMDNIEIPSAVTLNLQHFYNPLKKFSSNEEIYFPRVFSHNIMEVKDPCLFLARHEVTHPMRSRMIDWMIEVLKAYSFSEATFSLSVAIMDQYFSKVNKRIATSELHIIGVSSLFIASKFEEIVPFTLQKIFQKITHEKIPILAIKKTEADILQTLEFELSIPTLANLSSLMLKYLETQEFFGGHSSQEKDLFLSLNTYIFKLATFDYESIGNYCFKTIAICGIFVTTTVMNHCFNTQFLFQGLHNLLDIIRLSYDQIILLFNRLLTLAQTFESANPSLKNLKKHNLEEVNILSAKLSRPNLNEVFQTNTVQTTSYLKETQNQNTKTAKQQQKDRVSSRMSHQNPKFL